MEHLDVLVVGAGLSGICAGHYLQAECPWASYAVFEARGATGGTWDLFRYPGIRSDSDMNTLGFGFRPWDQEKTIADGASILRYIRETATAEGIDANIRFHHRVVAAHWSTPEACWHVTAERGDTGETFELTVEFLFSCTGYYRYDHGYQPDFEGVDDYRGTFVHPQHWPEDLDYEGKRIVVIGSGATAVTLIPALAERAAHVTMLQRSPTYIITMPDRYATTAVLRRVLPRSIAPGVTRWANALVTQAFYQVSRRRPKLVRRMLLRQVARQLPKGYDVTTHFTPSYDPWDQRVCLVPGGDLFRAIRRGRAAVVTDHVDTFTSTGIRLRSGTELEADIVVSATGLDLLFAGGMDVRVDGRPVEVSEKMMYKGMMLQDVPNMAVAIGYTNASWTLKCELTCRYVARLLNHLHERGLRQCTPVDHDTEITSSSVMGLSSGYVQRAAHRLPKQGSRFPWQVHQSYLRDYRATERTPVDDGTMEFTNPVPVPAPVGAA